MERAGAILIAGPTASGKSALAIRLAREMPGIVLNADSMQVYRDLRVLTARPTPEDEGAAPHRLFGHVDGAVNYSVGRYLTDAAAALDELDGSGLTPIFTGGTGLYFKALTEGLSDLPAVPDDLRAAIRASSAERPSADLHAELAERDPETAAKLRPSDRLRLLRALEILAATGRPLSSFQGARRPGLLASRPWRGLFLAPDRTTLRERIDRRFTAMIEAGALEEVGDLRRRGLDPALPVMRAHGVPALMAHLAGEMPLADAITRGQADTRAYAKRQVTWFRHQMPGFELLDTALGTEALVRSVRGSPAAG
ncbi:tRNA (adenosine(37)-N6)-dimethylallyltransferase MiaA [uncultured Enterovirga sp.]|uniref:tRNA (adenosine(37)-N6)-dimethylallyltransferase MiaA n=1 Tax=uncultured Enterovirga sp. TaxID=2026352 RepID=UPI0035C9FE35